MPSARHWCAASALGFTLAVVVGCSAPPPKTTSPSRETRERAYRANNAGVALLEQLKYPESAAAFRQALGVDPTLAIAHLNLSLALLYDQNLDEALKEATEAATRMPDAPQPPYVLGLVARAQNRNAEARTAFEKVRAIDAADIGTNVNLAQIALEDRRYDDAVTALQPIVAREPYHVTASYVLGLALTRSGKTDEGQVLLTKAQELRRASYAVTFGTGYLEQGRYAEAIASTGAEPDLVDPTVPSARFARAEISAATDQGARPPAFGRRVAPAELTDAGVRQLVASMGGGQTLVDIDADGTLELVVVSAESQRILRPAADGSTADITAASGFTTTSKAPAVGVLSADVDNDGSPDLFVLRASASSLYRNDGKGHFTDVTRAARMPAYPGLPGAAAFVDVDHDGDVDLLIGGLADLAATRQQRGDALEFPAGFAPAPVQLLRNNGNGTFTDITADARLNRRGHTIAIVPTDFDNHRDIDLLLVDADGAPALLANQRDGTFRDVAGDVGLTVPATPDVRTTAVATGDVNKDDYPDFFFARTGEGVFALSDGHGRFKLSAAPEQVRGASAAQLVDYDNDGLLDLVAQTSSGLTVLRNVGPSFMDVSAAVVDASPVPAGTVRGLTLADVERDGDIDVVASSGDSAWLWRNSGDPRNRSLRVQLRGRVTNRLGIGSKVQIRAGSLSARAETSAASPSVAPLDVVFGLGTRAGADVTRVLWPSGILQAETAPAAASGSDAAFLPNPFLVEELDRKPSSCPFLYVWNGERFEFVTDFLGGGEMGYWEGPGAWNHPDPVEYVRIRGEQLVPKNGRLQLRVTNELEEVLYVDQLQLMTIAHPADVQVYPNEGMTVEAKPYRLHGVRAPHTPARVTDEHGHDVTDRIARLDRRYPDDFAKSKVRGYADLHDLHIDLGSPTAPQTLLLTAWTDYAFSSDNVAANQGALPAVEPYLEARDARGTWRRLDVAIGIPVGRPQTIPLDLTPALRPGEHELRLRTTMRIYWDQIQVGDTVSAEGFAAKTADARSATLRERGFSADVRPDGQDPPSYDYGRVSTVSPWKAFTGSFTRVGDVLPLLAKADDHFVIAKTGDEVALEFDAPADALPPGWTRTYLLRGDGYSKEMDVNSASPDSVEPLPFHGMSRYPYPATERYPETPEHQAYRDQFNTRKVTRNIPKI